MNREYHKWFSGRLNRDMEVPMASEDLPNKAAAMTALDKLDDDLMQEQRALAQPRPRRYELAQVADR